MPADGPLARDLAAVPNATGGTLDLRDALHAMEQARPLPLITRGSHGEVYWTPVARALFAVDNIGHHLRSLSTDITPTRLSNRIHTWHDDGGARWRTGDRAVFSKILSGKRLPTPWEVAQLALLYGEPPTAMFTIAGRPFADYTGFHGDELTRRVELLALATQTARCVGRWLSGRVPDAKERMEVFSSTEHNPSTPIDAAAQTLFETMIRKALKNGAVEGLHEGDVQFLGEEVRHAEPLTDGALVAIIDPLDGTIPFIAGLPTWSVSIGMARYDSRADHLVPLCGVVYHPPFDELFFAVADGYAALDRRTGPAPCLTPLSPSPQTSLRRSILATHLSATSDAAVELFINSGLLRSLALVSRRLLMLGSGALALAYVAAGRVESFLNARAVGADVFAGKVILDAAARGSGRPAVVTDLGARPWSLAHKSVLATCTRELHEQISDLIAMHVPSSAR
jgi:myo-inositol-1(or 4)-monophosphatase